MNSLKHIKLAAFTGLIVGLIFGTIDIAARVIKLSFEWFELYQTLLISSAICVFVFVILSFFIELIRKVVKLKINKRTLSIFYAVSAASLILLFYGEIIMKLVLFYDIFTYSGTRFFFFTFVVFFIVGLIYILLLTKGKEFVFKIISYAKKKKIKKFINNYIFMVTVFVIVSFFMDIYLSNRISVSTSEIELEGYPNVLLIILDGVRPDHLSLYGYPLNTSPNLDRFAENAVVFDNAISASSRSLAGHTSIFVGKYPCHHNTTYKHQELDEKETTLAEILKAKGYITAGFTSGVFTKAKYGVAQGFMEYKDRLDFFEHTHTFQRFSIGALLSLIFPNFNKAILYADSERTSEETNKDIFKWLDKNKGKPFFMFINYLDAHEPYTLVKFKKYFTNETRDPKEIQKIGHTKRYDNVSKDLVDHIIKLYSAEIFHLDHNLNKLFDKLDELGIRDNTIIVITADHGDEFYDHGGFTHGETLYEEVTHVPLIIYYPKELKPQRIKKRIESIDLFATILDILNTTIPEDIDSISLVPLIKNKERYKKEYVISQLFGRIERPKLGETDQYAVSSNDWKLIEVYPKKEDRPSSLFNLKTDPHEQKNLYDVYIEKRKLLQEYYQSQCGNS